MSDVHDWGLTARWDSYAGWHLRMLTGLYRPVDSSEGVAVPAPWANRSFIPLPQPGGRLVKPSGWLWFLCFFYLHEASCDAAEQLGWSG